MTIKTVNLVYFSPTHTTQKVVKAIGEGTNLKVKEYDFTYLKNNPQPPTFSQEELVVIGVPVYVGRIPALLLPYLQAMKGNKTPCVLVAVYGNRHFDDCLVELEDLVKENGFLPVAASVFLGEHSFTNKLATQRPNKQDLLQAEDFGEKVIRKLNILGLHSVLPLKQIPGGRPYREPFNKKAGNPQPYCPVVNDNCISCGACAKACPTGAINPENVSDIDPGKCIKCRSCVKACPAKAIDMEKPSFWEHAKELEDTYSAYKPIITIV